MKRLIVAPAALSPDALSDLKQWLAISVSHDDALLTSLLRSSLDMFEAFTGTMPLVAAAEEVLAASGDWCGLSTRPILAISGIEAIPAQGARYPLPVADFEIELRADGTGQVRLIRQSDASRNAERVAVQFSAGLATDWAGLPDAIRQGVIRLAAYYYRERESTQTPRPPAAITALWQPWRRMRLA